MLSASSFQQAAQDFSRAWNEWFPGSEERWTWLPADRPFAADHVRPNAQRRRSSKQRRTSGALASFVGLRHRAIAPHPIVQGGGYLALTSTRSVPALGAHRALPDGGGRGDAEDLDAAALPPQAGYSGPVRLAPQILHLYIAYHVSYGVPVLLFEVFDPGELLPRACRWPGWVRPPF